MDELKIDKGVLLPTNRMSGKYANIRQSMTIMKVGDSVFLADVDSDVTNNILLQMKLKTPERRFCSRKVEGGRRIWRLM